jgi:RsiW-degrading membrane proteinase PrsW (M82 family)
MNDRPVCVVCHRPIEGEVYTLGGRTYDAEHYRGLARENKAAAMPLLVAVGVIVVFAAVVALVGGLISGALTGPVLLGAGVVIAVVPALVWLAAFYLQDRREPEPKEYVFGVFLLGALLAAAVGQPVIRDLFRVQDWTADNAIIAILASILIVGFVQETLIYAAIRHTIYRSSEFDERVDGIIYGAAVGLGYATTLNIQYVVNNGGVDLGVGVLRVAVAALAQASFAGVIGYFLGRAKFEDMGMWWLPGGLTLAAVLNGIVTYLLGEVSTINSTSVRSSLFTPWLGLVVAVVVAGLTFFVLFTLIRRLNAAHLAGARA